MPAAVIASGKITNVMTLILINRQRPSASRPEAICLEWFNLFGRKSALGDLWDFDVRVYRERHVSFNMPFVQKDMPATILNTSSKYDSQNRD